VYRVLIVEDDRAVQKLTAESLRRMRMECHLASDGVEASQRLQMAPYDAVITDMRMPRRHGHALCVELLAWEQRPLVAVLTGVNDPRLVHDLEARGVDAVFLKPVDYRAFARRIWEMLEARRRNAPSASAVTQTVPAPSGAADGTVGVSDAGHELLAMLGYEGSAAAPALDRSDAVDPNWLV